MSKDLIVQPRLFTDAMLGIATPELDEVAFLAAIRTKVKEEQVLTQLGVAQEDLRSPEEISEDIGVLQEARRLALANTAGQGANPELTEWLALVKRTLEAWEDQRRRKMAAARHGLRLAS